MSQQPNTGINALCLLAFLGRGHVPGRGPYKETVDRAAVFAVPTLESEYEEGGYAGILDDFDNLRANGSLVQRVLAEGLESVVFETPAAASGTAQARFVSQGSETLAVIAPIPLEVPLR